MSQQKLIFPVSAEHIDVRIDQFLGAKNEIGSRTKALFLLGEKRVQVNQKNVKPSYCLRSGDVVLVEMPPPEPTGLLKYDFPLDIIFEDADVIVVNKPAGLVVHPAHGHHGDTLVNALLHYTSDLSMRFGEERPGIVHRIDKETSGLLIIAKNDMAHEKLSAQFKIKKTKRIYEAVVFGIPEKKQGHIESYLARHPQHRKKYASIKGTMGLGKESGKLAITDYAVIHGVKPFSLIELKLTTGRTHQIRVHLSELGYPIVGDVLYGAEKKLKQITSSEQREDVVRLGRFLLHAKVLGFFHPRTGEWREFQVAWPDADDAFIKKWIDR